MQCKPHLRAKKQVSPGSRRGETQTNAHGPKCTTTLNSRLDIMAPRTVQGVFVAASWMSTVAVLPADTVTEVGFPPAASCQATSV